MEHRLTVSFRLRARGKIRGGFFTYSPCGETRMASDTLSCSMLPLLGRMWNWPEVVCSKPL
jgi:hypothetical protein